MARNLNGFERWELRRGEEAYPQKLLDMEEPPEVIYGVGDPAVLSTMGLAVIGARLASPYGLAIASMAGRIAAESGITLVSGGARGCDAEAARGALDAGGKTIVVSGIGANLIYPSVSEDVFLRAAGGGGAVISLVRWDSPVRRYQFLRRNRVIAALSLALLVSEAGQRSGTTSTAMAAIELGRQVYAAPGSIFSPQSFGANALIRDGAGIVTSEVDLEMLISRDFGVLRLISEEVATPKSRLLSALIASPMRPDDLAHSLGETPVDVIKRLMEYELQGAVMRLPDGRYGPTKELLLGKGRIEAAS